MGTNERTHRQMISPEISAAICSIYCSVMDILAEKQELLLPNYYFAEFSVISQTMLIKFNGILNWIAMLTVFFYFIVILIIIFL